MCSVRFEKTTKNIILDERIIAHPRFLMRVYCEETWGALQIITNGQL
jgi:hypothetical protein